MNNNLTTLSFGQRLYRLESIERNWCQKSTENAVECAVCGAILSFCFANRLNPSIAGLAATSVIPVAVRCDCGKYTRQPVRITPEPALETALAAAAIRPSYE
jgi:hypothetical protein